ncbi:MAG: gamma-glutamyl-phosphate reductase, partial [Chloroflexi bacterium]|nr:gamma-glutamyl-phosphate reductase [Chloroflexota bacterium]
MQASIKELEEKCKAAKTASRKLAFLNTETKNKAILAMADALVANQKTILAANELDYKESEASGMS